MVRVQDCVQRQICEVNVGQQIIAATDLPVVLDDTFHPLFRGVHDDALLCLALAEAGLQDVVQQLVDSPGIHQGPVSVQWIHQTMPGVRPKCFVRDLVLSNRLAGCFVQQVIRHRDARSWTPRTGSLGLSHLAETDGKPRGKTVAASLR